MLSIPTVNPKKLETGLRPISAGIPYTLLLGIEAIRFPTFGLLLYVVHERYALVVRVHFVFFGTATGT